MLFSSESPDSYYILLKPEYREKPPTVRLLNSAFHNFCDLHRIEIYPQATRPIRLPFGPRQEPLDFEYSYLGDWESKLYWFQKLDSFDIQKEILRLAFEKKFVTSTEILTELRGWQPRARGTQKSTIGKARYACRHASLSRCLTRLWLRGLIGILRNTGEDELKSSYFTQTLLKDYMEEYNPPWDVVFDARGHITEPHTGEVVGLGGLEVRSYVDRFTDEIFDETPELEPEVMIPTKGPGLR